MHIHTCMHIYNYIYSDTSTQPITKRSGKRNKENNVNGRGCVQLLHEKIRYICSTGFYLLQVVYRLNINQKLSDHVKGRIPVYGILVLEVQHS